MSTVASRKADHLLLARHAHAVENFKGQHPKEQCPAREAVCGRWSLQSSKLLEDSLRRHQRREWQPHPLSGYGVYGHKVKRKRGSPRSAWERKKTRFKLDTGAEVTAITQDTHRQLGKPSYLPFQAPPAGAEKAQV